MSDQQVKYTITADATQANNELAKVDKAAVSLVGNERALADATTRATAAIAKEQKAAEAAAKAIADYGAESNKAAKAVAAHERASAASAKAILGQQRATESLAIATKKAADEAAKAAGGTRNVGQAALEASRGIEDLQYGIGGVVNNIPSLVMALGGGAGLTAAISLGSIAVAQLVKHSGDMIDEFGRAERESKALMGEISRLATVASESLAKSFEMTRSSVEDAATALRNFGKDSKQIAEDEIIAEISRNSFRLERQKQLSADRQTNIDAMKAEATALEAHGRFREVIVDGERVKRGVFNEERYIQLEQEIKLQSALLKISDNKVKETSAVVGAQMAEASSLAEINAELRVREEFKKAEDDAKKGGKAEKVNAESEVRALIAQQERQDEMIGKSELAYETMAENEIRILMERDQKISDIASDAYKKQEEERARNQKASDREKLKQEKKSLKDIEAEQKRHAQQNAEYATQATSIVTGATQQYVEARIKGEKDAEAMFVASIMAQAGQALVGYGIQAIGRGVLEASNPVTAVLAPGSFGTGAALIGAGVGLGGVSAGIGHISAGGTIGKELPDKKAAKDKGASPGRGGSGSGGGPLVVNVAYGVGGPLPEDTAREISKAVNTGRRRGGR